MKREKETYLTACGKKVFEATYQSSIKPKKTVLKMKKER